MKKTIFIAVLIVGFSAPLFAQSYNEELPEGSISVDLTVVSNYIFRGDDFHKTAAQGRGIRQAEHTGAAAFQPSITLGMPVDGFYFNIWGSYAMEHRYDRDQDKVVQQGPGGADIYASAVTLDGGETYSGYSYRNPAQPKDWLFRVPKAVLDAEMAKLGTSDDVDNYQALIKNQILGTDADATDTITFMPGLYKEQNGLARADETDISFGYETATRVGTLGGGIVTYLVPARSVDYGTEFFVTYGAPNNVPVYASLHGNDDTGDTAFKVGFAPTIELAEGTELGFDVAATHQARSANGQGYRGISHYDVGVSFSTQGFNISINGAYRADYRFYDGTQSGDLDATGAAADLIHLLGGSTAGDGYVVDTSRQVGMYDSYVNTITDEIYDEAYNPGGTNSLNGGRGKLPYIYTPRYKLSRWVYWTSIGYTIEI